MKKLILLGFMVVRSLYGMEEPGSDWIQDIFDEQHTREDQAFFPDYEEDAEFGSRIETFRPEYSANNRIETRNVSLDQEIDTGSIEELQHTRGPRQQPREVQDSTYEQSSQNNGQRFNVMELPESHDVQDDLFAGDSISEDWTESMLNYLQGPLFGGEKDTLRFDDATGGLQSHEQRNRAVVAQKAREQEIISVCSDDEDDNKAGQTAKLDINEEQRHIPGSEKYLKQKFFDNQKSGNAHLNCNVCKKGFGTRKSLRVHITTSKSHQKKEKKLNTNNREQGNLTIDHQISLQSLDPKYQRFLVKLASGDEHLICRICKVGFDDRYYLKRHRNTKKHLLNLCAYEESQKCINSAIKKRALATYSQQDRIASDQEKIDSEETRAHKRQRKEDSDAQYEVVIHEVCKCYCGYRAKTHADAQLHAKKPHTFPYVCIASGCTSGYFWSLDALDQHKIESHSMPLRIADKNDNRKLRRPRKKSLLTCNQRWMNSQASNVQSFHCDICKKGFEDQNKLDTHNDTETHKIKAYLYNQRLIAKS